MKRTVTWLLLKSHVKAHTRVVNGRVVQVRDYDDKRTKKAAPPAAPTRAPKVEVTPVRARGAASAPDNGPSPATYPTRAPKMPHGAANTAIDVVFEVAREEKEKFRLANQRYDSDAWVNEAVSKVVEQRGLGPLLDSFDKDVDFGELMGGPTFLRMPTGPPGKGGLVKLMMRLQHPGIGMTAINMALSICAREEFGLADSTPITDSEHCTVAECTAKWGKYFPIFQAWMRGTYNRTQDFLKSNGMETLTLVRAMTFDDMDAMPETLRNAHHKHVNVHVQLRPLSSFTCSLKRADAFAKGHQFGTVLAVQVPRERILGMYYTGMGDESQGEFVVAGGMAECGATTFKCSDIIRGDANYGLWEPTHVACGSRTWGEAKRVLNDDSWRTWTKKQQADADAQHTAEYSEARTAMGQKIGTSVGETAKRRAQPMERWPGLGEATEDK